MQVLQTFFLLNILIALFSDDFFLWRLPFINSIDVIYLHVCYILIYKLQCKPFYL